MSNTRQTRRPNLDGSHYYSEAEKVWIAWVTVGTKSDGSPDRRQRKAKTESAVLAKKRKLEALREARKPSRAGRSPTVQTWMTTYLDTICAQQVASGKMSPRTLDDYRSKNARWIVRLLGQHRLDRLLPEHLDEAYAAMYGEGKSSSTVLKVHRILSRALEVAVRRGHVGHNVCRLVDAPEPADTEIEPFTREEARRILEAAKGRRNGPRWSVALALGIRQGEALGLRWPYVDLETGVIRAWFQVQRAEWRHGCDDPNACGQAWHRRPCRKPCKTHQHREDCAAGCTRRGHVCARRRHAARRRASGMHATARSERAAVSRSGRGRESRS